MVAGRAGSKLHFSNKLATCTSQDLAMITYHVIEIAEVTPKTQILRFSIGLEKNSKGVKGS